MKNNNLQQPIENLLRSLLTGKYNADLNPYCVPEIKEMLKALAIEKGMGEKNWLDAVKTN